MEVVGWYLRLDLFQKLYVSPTAPMVVAMLRYHSDWQERSVSSEVRIRATYLIYSKLIYLQGKIQWKVGTHKDLICIFDWPYRYCKELIVLSFSLPTCLLSATFCNESPFFSFLSTPRQIFHKHNCVEHPILKLYINKEKLYH